MCGCHTQNDWISKAMNVSNFAVSVNIFPWKLFRWLRRQHLWATGDWQLHHNNAPAHATHLVQFFDEMSNHLGDSALLQSGFGTLWLLTFPKTKSPLKGGEISNHWWDSGKYEEQLIVIGRTVWGPKVPTLKETEVLLSYVQCFLYLVSSSINVFIIHCMWSDKFWKDIVYIEIFIHFYIYSNLLIISNEYFFGFWKNIQIKKLWLIF